MGYIDKNLMEGEEVLYRAKLHWAVFIWPVIWLVVAILFFTAGKEMAVWGVIFLLLAIIMGLSALITYATSEFGLTNKRVVGKIGFIRRNSIEVLLSKVEGIQVKQGIIGRIFNYGTVTISGTGGLKDPFKKIARPLEFRKKVQERIGEAGK